MRTPSVGLLPFLLACGPKAPPPAPAAAAPPPAPDSREIYVWKAEKGDATNYLVGTCHIGVPLEAVLPPETHGHVLDEARVLLTEVDMSSLDLAEMAKLLTGDADGSLSALMAPEAFWGTVQRVPQVPVTLLTRLPAFLGASILTMMAPGPERFAEIYLAAEANGRTTFRDLETIEEQLSIVGASDAQIAAELSEPDALEASLEEFGAVFDACFRQDRSALTARYAGREATTVDANLLGRRNRSWMPVLLEEFGQGGAVAAVGAAHIVGPEGLTDLLAAEGWTITPQTTTAPLPPPPELGDLTDAVLKDLPEPDPASEAQWLMLVGMVGKGICDAPPIQACLAPDAARCQETVLADAELCVRQHLPSLPDFASVQADPEAMQASAMAVAACIGAGVTLDGLADIPLDVPMCADFLETVKSQSP